MKGKIKYTILIASILGIAFASCKKEQHPPAYFGYDYFPNKVGHYIIYECDSIVHTNGFGNFHYKYQVKEVIDSIYLNNQGQPTQRIARYYRPNGSTLSWSSIFTPQKVWLGNLLSNVAKRQEDNYVYAKLVFPMTLNETWNGNAYNSIGTGLGVYQYTALNTPSTITNSNGSVYFDSTLTLLQYTNSNLLNYAYYLEKYATGVGLIYKVVDYDTSTVFSQTSPPDSSLSTTYGVWYTETYLSSGNQ